MMFLVINAVLSAIFFLIVVLPPLYIYNPDRHPGESNNPPRAGEVIPDQGISHAVKQKLYLLYVIPFCGAVNAVFLYFAYYRPIRYIHYRVELNLLTLRLTLDAGRQQLQKNGVLNAMNRNSTASNVSIIGAGAGGSGGGPNNNSVFAYNYSKAPGRSFAFDGNENSRKKLASSVDWEWRRHARPKTVRRDAWVNSAVFSEISELRDEVEQHFLLEGSVADANFAKAMVKTVGAFLPMTTSTILANRVQLPEPEAQQRAFYNSSRPPLMLLGSRTSVPDRGGIHGYNGNSVNSANGAILRGASMEHDPVMPLRGDSVIMVPTESPHRKNNSGGGDSGTAGGGSGGRSVAGSALRFFKGAHNNGVTSRNSNLGNGLEENSQTRVRPGLRDAFEPVMVDEMSPIESPNADTALHMTRLDDSFRKVGTDNRNDHSSSNKDKRLGWPWHRDERKESHS